MHTHTHRAYEYIMFSSLPLRKAKTKQILAWPFNSCLTKSRSELYPSPSAFFMHI